jgi:hypothetical protein
MGLIQLFASLICRLLNPQRVGLLLHYSAEVFAKCVAFCGDCDFMCRFKFECVFCCCLPVCMLLLLLPASVCAAVCSPTSTVQLR